MEIKIHCSCGTKYKFDADPVDGRMSAPVQCPSCGLDGTEAANEFIQHSLALAPRVRVKVAADPVPEPPANLSNPATVAAPPTPTLAPPLARKAPTTPMIPATASQKKRAYGEPNMVMGTVGAGVAALIGMIVWYLIIVGTHTEIGIIAWAVGGLTGFGCRVLGGGYSQKLGIIAGACAFLAIVGGEFLATRAAYNEFLGTFIEGAYEARVEQAQKAATLETEDQMRAFLAEEMSDEEKTVSAAEVTPQQLDEFRKEGLPKLKALADGKPSKADFEREIRAGFNSAGMQGELLKASFSLWTLLWLFLGVGSAYRLGVGETQ